MGCDDCTSHTILRDDHFLWYFGHSSSEILDSVQNSGECKVGLQQYVRGVLECWREILSISLYQYSNHKNITRIALTPQRESLDNQCLTKARTPVTKTQTPTGTRPARCDNEPSSSVGCNLLLWRILPAISPTRSHPNYRLS